MSKMELLEVRTETEYKKKKFKIGQGVYFDYTASFGYDPEGNRICINMPLPKAKKGIIVGARYRPMGKFYYGREIPTGPYGGEEYQEASFDRSGRKMILVWLIRTAYIRKPYEVQEQHIFGSHEEDPPWAKELE